MINTERGNGAAVNEPARGTQVTSQTAIRSNRRMV